MGSEFSGGGSGAPRDDQLIFMSDASAEAERLMSALRSRGYAVVEVPLALLVGRVSVQKPALILCDVDATPCLLYTSPSPRDRTRSRMPSSA